MAYLLREISANGSITDHQLDSMSNIEAAEGSTYSLIDSETQQTVEGAGLKRRGDNLEVEIEGETVASLEGFYTDGAGASFSDGSSVVSTTADTGSAETIWHAAEIGGVNAGLIALGVGAVALASGGGSTAAQTILVAAAAGPFVTTMGVEIYGNDGTLLAELEHDFSTGPVPVNISGDYTGAILVKVIDINGDAGDYLDEATGEILSLGSQSIRAMATTDNAEVSVTPLTELATVLAGVTDDNTVTEEQVTTNDQVEELFGVTDILGDVVTIVDDEFDTGDGTSDAEAYGAVLALLSGVDYVSGGVEETIAAIADSITEDEEGNLVLDDEAVALIAEGLDVISESDAGAEEAIGEVIEVIVPEEVIADTTPPTVTISAIEISTDTGSSDSDLITNTAAQTVTATLSAELETGEVLLVSVDGGTTFTDATSSVTGTAISLQTTLVSGSIQFRVDDASGNQGVVASQAFTLDTTAPVITSVVVNADSTVTVTFDVAVDDLEGDETSFTLTVNGEAYSFVSAEGDGTTVTLVPAQDIYESDTVTALSSTASDVAGNTPANVTTITNNSIGQVLEVSKANDEITSSADLVIDQTGGAGNDLLSVNIFEGESDSLIADLDIGQAGEGGNDAINATLDAQFIGAEPEIFGGFRGPIRFELGESGSSSESGINLIEQDGGAGDDALSVSLNAVATAVEVITQTSTFSTEGGGTATTTRSGTGVFVGIVSNEVSMSGGSGSDTLALDVFASGSGSELARSGIDVEISQNDFSADGGSGADSLVAEVRAVANNEATGTGTFTTIYPWSPSTPSTISFSADADATVSYNDIDYLGGSGVDSLIAGLYATAAAEGEADAEVYENQIYATAENADVDLVANATANDASATNSYNGVFLNVSYNTVTASSPSGSSGSSYSSYSRPSYGSSSYSSITTAPAPVDGAVDIAINFSANAVGNTDAYALVYENEVLAYGGDSADEFALAFVADASVPSSTGNTDGFDATATNESNNVDIYALGGDDFIGLQFGAFANNNATGTGVNIGTYSSGSYSSSSYSSYGSYGSYGSYSESFGQQAGAAVSDNESVYLYGGTGRDTIDIDATAIARAGYEAEATVEYLEVEATGEVIMADLSAVATAMSANAYVYENELLFNEPTGSNNPVTGSLGGDFDVNMTAIANGSTYAYASVESNDIESWGHPEEGDDYDLALYAFANIAEATGQEQGADAYAYVSENYIELDGNGGTDAFDLQLGAFAVNYATGTGLNVFSGTYTTRNYTGTSTTVTDVTTYTTGTTVTTPGGGTTYSVLGTFTSPTTYITYTTTATTTNTYTYFERDAYQQEASASVSSNDIQIFAGNAVDSATIAVNAFAQATAEASAEVAWLDVDVTAIENLDFDVSAQANANYAEATASYISVDANLLYIDTSAFSGTVAYDLAGNADLNIDLVADANGGTYAYALLQYNDFALYANQGSDTIGLALNAYADLDGTFELANPTGSGSGSGSYSSYSSYSSRGSYSDQASYATAYVYSTDVSVRAGAGNDDITVQAGAYVDNDIVQSATSLYSGSDYHAAYAYNSNLEIYLDGQEGIDSLDIDLTASAAANTSAYANVYNAYFSLSAENVDIDLVANAQASDSGEAYAYVYSNSIYVNSFSSPDGAVMANINLSAVASGTDDTSLTDASVYNNSLYLYGGDAVDTIAVSFVAEQAYSNQILVEGGAGADTFSFDVSNVVSFSENTFTFYYGSTGEFGDSIVGLDATVFSTNDVVFNFQSAFGSAYFTTDLSTNHSSNAFFFYDTYGPGSGTTQSYALYYDADGSGTGAASAVAIFDEDVGFGSSNITGIVS
jgi:hypothetical protein